jgi:DNA-binding response OmpR family regulator
MTYPASPPVRPTARYLAGSNPCRCAPGSNTILLVEPDACLRDIYVTLFTFHGYSVEAVETGREALECARARHVCVMVIEMELPDTGGLKIAQELREGPGTASTALILTTARSGVLARRLAWQVGCRGYLEKPFVPRELISEVERILSTTPEPAYHVGAEG